MQSTNQLIEKKSEKDKGKGEKDKGKREKGEKGDQAEKEEKKEEKRKGKKRKDQYWRKVPHQKLQLISPRKLTTKKLPPKSTVFIYTTPAYEISKYSLRDPIRSLGFEYEMYDQGDEVWVCMSAPQPDDIRFTGPDGIKRTLTPQKGWPRDSRELFTVPWISCPSLTARGFPLFF